MFRTLLGEELKKLSGIPGASRSRYDEAAWLLERLVSSDEFIDFLTEPAYELVSALPEKQKAAA